MPPRKRPTALEIWEENEAEQKRASAATSEEEHRRKRQMLVRRFTPDVSIRDEPGALANEKPLHDFRQPVRMHEDVKVPVRLLSDFVFYDKHRLEMVPFSEIVEHDDLERISVVGKASSSAWLDLDEVLEWDDDLPVEKEWIETKLDDVASVLVDFCGRDPTWVHSLDTIMIRTSLAFYVLGCPLESYFEYYEQSYVQYRLAQFIVRKTQECPGWTERVTFEASLAHDEVLDRMLSPHDLRGENEQPIQAILRKYIEDVEQRRNAGGMVPTSDELARISLFLTHAPPYTGPQRPPLRVTPNVHRLARKWFRTEWEVLNISDNAVKQEDNAPSAVADNFKYDPQTALVEHLAHLSDRWEEPAQRDACESSTADGARYKTMTCNSIKYTTHHVVKVKGGSSVAAEMPVWFARVAYFFVDRNDRIMFHAEYLDRACSEGILGSTGCELEMFVVLQCADIDVGAILGPPIEMGDDPAAGKLFSRILFDGGTWISLKSILALYAQRGACFVAAYNASTDARHATQDRAEGDSMLIRGVRYHQHDFVYLSADVQDASRIVQIRLFLSSGKVRVARMDRGAPGNDFSERKVSLSRDAFDIPALDVVGRCRVVMQRPTNEEFDVDPWLFYAEGVQQGETCRTCLRAERSRQAQEQEFAQQQRRLVMLDPFAGAGGLAVGIERGSQCIDSKYAIDIDKPATQAFETNHPDSHVFNVDASKFLGATAHGTLLDSKELPKKGKIDVICAGVPCQGHSSLNMHRTADDPKNCQILVALSYVEYYRPKYFVLENVIHIVTWQLMARQAGQGRIRGGVKYGGLRLVISILLELGYQVRVGLLNAGMYGVPQNRRRFFLFAATLDCTLPASPHPTHAFRSLTLKIPAFPNALPAWPVALEGQGRNGDDDAMRQPPLCIPHPMVTVGNAIGDLHRFDWKSEKQRPPRGAVPAFKCDPKKGCRPNFESRYQLQPQNSFQVRARMHSQDLSLRRLQHATAGFAQYIVENVWDVPHSEKADYRDVSNDRRTAQHGLSGTTSHMARAGFTMGRYYLRLKETGFFRTLVTNVRPTAKQAQVLHFNQNRLVTVREQARGQGFLDTYRFEGDVVDMQRQIGNAVPVPLAEAIGRQLRDSMFQDWCASQNQ